MRFGDYLPTSQGGMIVIGDYELDAALADLGYRGSKAVVVAGIRAGLTVMAQAIRREINAISTGTPNEASLRRGMRKAVRKRFRRRKGRRDYEAKVGFAVGMTAGKRLARLSQGRTLAGRKKPTAGVAGADVHWFAMTGVERTGMEPFYKGVVARAHAASSEPALQRAIEKMKQRLPIEAERARKRGGK